MKRTKEKELLRPSSEQEHILNLPLEAGSITVIKAFAGTGKTATLRMIAESRPNQKILYIVYNKAMADEAKKAFPPNVQVRTSHSIAFEICGSHYADTLGALRSKDISTALGLSPTIAIAVVETLNHWFHTISSDINDEHLPSNCVDHTKVIEAARKTWTSIVKKSSPLPMPHDGYQKLWSLSSPSGGLFDLVFADEAHDLNPVVLDFVFRCASKDKSSVVFVGDAHQSIYSWRGAIDAISLIEARAASVARLTRSFRFGPSIARDASIILMALKSEKINLVGVGGKNTDTNNYCVIARTNFALIEHALHELSADPEIALHFSGTKKTEKWSPRIPYRFNELLDVLSLYKDTSSAIKTEYFKRFRSWQELIDYANAGDQELAWLVRIVGQYGNELPAALQLIEQSAVPQKKADITYSTAHRSKGLEWDYVEALSDFISPPEILARLSDPKTTPHQRKTLLEEANLHYVAFTRAKRRLTLNMQLRKWLDESYSKLSE
jgi:superfamily I DNA/RNA helicase